MADNPQQSPKPDETVSSQRTQPLPPLGQYSRTSQGRGCAALLPILPLLLLLPVCGMMGYQAGRQAVSAPAGYVGGALGIAVGIIIILFVATSVLSDR